MLSKSATEARRSRCRGPPRLVNRGGDLFVDRARGNHTIRPVIPKCGTKEFPSDPRTQNPARQQRTRWESIAGGPSHRADPTHRGGEGLLTRVAGSMGASRGHIPAIGLDRNVVLQERPRLGGRFGNTIYGATILPSVTLTMA